MGTQVYGSTGSPPDNTHNAKTTTNAQWRSDSSITTSQDSYIDSVNVYCGSEDGSSSTFKGCVWNTSNTLLGSTPGIVYGTGYGMNGFPFAAGALLFLSSGTVVRAGFQASNHGSQLGLLHNAGHYWEQGGVSSPANFGGTQDPFGSFGDMAWYLSYFPPASISSVPSVVQPGSNFTVTGLSFTAGIVSANIGGLNCPVVSVNSDTSLTLTAPSTGIQGQLTVITNAGTAVSAGSIIVGQIWVNRGGVASPISIWIPNGGGVQTVKGVWVPNGVGGVKRIW